MHDDRRLNACRQQRSDRIGRRNDLGDREVQIDVRLEVDLLNGQPVQRLGFHVLDAVDVRADRILAVGSDALLHLGRAEAGVLPDHRNYRNIDLRKNVRRHRIDRADAQEQYQRSNHIECMRKPQSEANDSHLVFPVFRKWSGSKEIGSTEATGRSSFRQDGICV